MLPRYEVPTIVSFQANQISCMSEKILEVNKVAAMREEMREVVAKEVAALREEVIFEILEFAIIIVNIVNIYLHHIHL